MQLKLTGLSQHPHIHKRTIQDGVTADEVAEVHGHQAVCDELRKNVHADRRPLSKVSPKVQIYHSIAPM